MHRPGAGERREGEHLAGPGEIARGRGAAARRTAFQQDERISERRQHAIADAVVHESASIRLHQRPGRLLEVVQDLVQVHAAEMAKANQLPVLTTSAMA